MENAITTWRGCDESRAEEQISYLRECASSRACEVDEGECVRKRSWPRWLGWRMRNAIGPREERWAEKGQSSEQASQGRTWAKWMQHRRAKAQSESAAGVRWTRSWKADWSRTTVEEGARLQTRLGFGYRRFARRVSSCDLARKSRVDPCNADVQIPHIIHTRFAQVERVERKAH